MAEFVCAVDECAGKKPNSDHIGHRILRSASGDFSSRCSSKRERHSWRHQSRRINVAQRVPAHIGIYVYV